MGVVPFDYEGRLAACAQGKQTEFEELYRHEAPQMLALCLKMLPQRAAAEEIVHDTFVLLWKNASNYDPETGTARAWIYSIMRYRALNRLRRSQRTASAPDPWTDTLPGNLNSGQQSDSQKTAESIAQLDQARRRPILMAFYNGLTYDQIATRLNRSVDQIKTDVHAAVNVILEREHA